jgi:type IV pilus assembly protein PilV
MPIVNRFHQRGVSLIESMIALLVISVGLLGIAALQVTAVSQNASALNHSRAVWIAYNMADRIRANGGQFIAYNDIKTTNTYVDPDCIANNCSAAQMVTADAAEWTDMVTALPSGQGIIAGDANNLEISVMWDDEGTGATGTGCNPDPDDLTCYIVAISQ